MRARNEPQPNLFAAQGDCSRRPTGADQASIMDVTATVNRLYSQAREMRERALEIVRVRHGVISGDAA